VVRGGGGCEGCVLFLLTDRTERQLLCAYIPYTDKKENKIFLIYKEIQKGAVAKSIWLTGSSYMTEYLRISSYIRKPFLLYDFATAPFWISLYLRKILFYFLSVYCIWGNIEPDDSAGSLMGSEEELKVGVQTECWPCTPPDRLVLAPFLTV
jgi:hypothetical protein